MAGITSQASHARSLQEGINAIAGLTYTDYPIQADKIFTTYNSEKAYEVDVSESPTGLASLKPEGSSTGYDSSKQDFATTYENAVYSLGAIITMEAQMNNLMTDLIDKTGTMLKRSAVHTHEQLAADVINNAYTTNIGDGVPLASASHVLGKGGTFSNRFAVFTPLSQAALEDAQTALEDYRDGAGLLIQAEAVSLHIPRQLRWTAERILKSPYEPNTANTATYNTMQNAMPFHVNTRFTSASEWFLKTNIDNGFKIFNRMDYTFSQDNDFGTENFRTKVMFYRSYGATDPRCAYFSGQ
jgi:hypothetical protein